MTSKTHLSNNTDIDKHMTMVRIVVNRLLFSRRLFYLLTEREDLYQIGWMSLNNCIKTFDKTRGIKFDTYASKAIRHAANNELVRLSKRRMFSIQINNDTLMDYPTVKDTEMQHIIDLIENTRHFILKERAVFWLRFIDEQRFSDIGKRLNISRETARRMYYKSISKLKELLADG